jgi:uncharacterized small protein (DUF1192 family)
MSEDRVREIEDKIADLKAQLEKLENELEKAREAGKTSRHHRGWPREG